MKKNVTLDQIKLLYASIMRKVKEIGSIGKVGTGNNSILLNDIKENVASGDYSLAEGYGTTATKEASHAEGYETTVEGYYSHVEGYRSQVNGNYAHAEGKDTIAQGDASHAEGDACIAKGPSSHAEGYNTFAQGNAAHSEGWSTIARSDYSHSEGYQSYASGEYAHAEGYKSYATGSTTHAEGYQSYATGVYAHAEGNKSRAEGVYSHAEGDMSKATGYGAHSECHGTAQGSYSHAEGFDSYAIGNYSHAEGHLNKANGYASHAEGKNSQAIGNYSHAEGGSTTNGLYSHAEGCYTNAKGDYSHAEGNNTYAGGNYSHAEGYGAAAVGDFSHAEGESTRAEGAWSHTEGYVSRAIGAYSHVEGVYCVAHGTAAHVQGAYNIEDTLGKYLHIVGNGTVGNQSNAHTLDWNGNAEFAGDVIINGCGGENPISLKNTFGENFTSISQPNIYSQTMIATSTVASIKWYNVSSEIHDILRNRTYSSLYLENPAIGPYTANFTYAGTNMGGEYLFNTEMSDGRDYQLRVSYSPQIAINITDVSYSIEKEVILYIGMGETIIKIPILKESAIPNNVPKIQSAEVGQTLAVKMIDENGKPTEWEVVEPFYKVYLDRDENDELIYANNSSFSGILEACKKGSNIIIKFPNNNSFTYGYILQDLSETTIQLSNCNIMDDVGGIAYASGIFFHPSSIYHYSFSLSPS